ncbi:MAG: hypothetical protein DCC68_18570 [Planctomycetota bacterium]|nr:MAG: hypothetical protein DCC68_18570 [Planctomycetota bacterium]
MLEKSELRLILRENLDETIRRVNLALRGSGLKGLAKVLSRIGRGAKLPHWYERLRHEKSLPNLDGKTVGSVVEMLLVAVLETHTFASVASPPLRINPARGVDLPDLDLGVKSPSENFCTSEPFFSAYERLIGAGHDILVLLTDYQSRKNTPPLRLQIIKWRYLACTEIADEQLCRIALKHRPWLLAKSESWTQRVYRFLAYVNQSDWRAKQLLRMVDLLDDDAKIRAAIDSTAADFRAQNARRERRNEIPLPDSDFEAIQRIADIHPLHTGVIDAADNWVAETQKDAGRLPNENEWQRLRDGPLDGKIGMSFALQWRYNFGRLFGEPSTIA